ncbi:proline-rich receptor-like protein kinase PERK9 [Cervus canadensis]|uniref:proline-rich receptor-like protein kinase PERK9 n=1 Tax=Cervus canadensis TaxID=1574408 RepID=UPI001C9E7D73|nr:proline-rich receptor-like protein kinase PERK9 [Cervus canadensis]
MHLLQGPISGERERLTSLLSTTPFLQPTLRSDSIPTSPHADLPTLTLSPADAQARQDPSSSRRPHAPISSLADPPPLRAPHSAPERPPGHYQPGPSAPTEPTPPSPPPQIPPPAPSHSPTAPGPHSPASLRSRSRTCRQRHLTAAQSKRNFSSVPPISGGRAPAADLIGTGFHSRSSLHSSPHFGSSLASHSAPALSLPASPPSSRFLSQQLLP